MLAKPINLTRHIRPNKATSAVAAEQKSWKKRHGLTVLAHIFWSWSKGIVLSTDNVTLRTTEWEELLPRGEGDHDVGYLEQSQFT